MRRARIAYVHKNQKQPRPENTRARGPKERNRSEGALPPPVRALVSWGRRAALHAFYAAAATFKIARCATRRFISRYCAAATPSSSVMPHVAVRIATPLQAWQFPPSRLSRAASFSGEDARRAG